MPKLRIALLAGGISSEREVSLNGGGQVQAALDKEKYIVSRYDPQCDLPRLVADAAQIDFALIILHGLYGEDGTVQGLLDLLDIPYQGSGVLGSALAMNKLSSKHLYMQWGIPTPAYGVVRQAERLDPEQWIKRLGLPLVVKPVAGGSSVGVSIIEDAADLKEAVERAFESDTTVMLEAYIEGLEITGGIMGNQELEALPLIEIVPDRTHGFFDYEAKYTAGVTQEICPARIAEDLTAKAQSYAQMAHRALFCQGYSRTDMILQGRSVYVLETNTIPGMTTTSLLPQAAAAAGLSFGTLLDRLIELGLEKPRPRHRAR
jgi:D-alanine-D-alanine ligase